MTISTAFALLASLAALALLIHWATGGRFPRPRRPRGGFTPRRRYRSLWAVALLALAVSPLPAANGCALFDVASAAHDEEVDVTPGQAWYAVKADFLLTLELAKIVYQAENTPAEVKSGIQRALAFVPDLTHVDVAVTRLGSDPAALAVVIEATTALQKVLSDLAEQGVALTTTDNVEL